VQVGIGELLEGEIVVDGEGGGGAGGLAEDHENRFHADRAIRNVSG